MLGIGSAHKRTLLAGTYIWLAKSLEMDDHSPECQGPDDPSKLLCWLGIRSPKVSPVQSSPVQCLQTPIIVEDKLLSLVQHSQF